jgi:cell division protein FtsZ
MSLDIKNPDSVVLKPTIIVFGVGGAGGNAVNNMLSSKLQGANFVVANTDAQSLEYSLCENKIQLGAKTTKGLGAGADPLIGALAAEESEDEIRRYLANANMVFVTAGMGGGTGTGASPFVARIAKELGILTVGVVTKPFHFEGMHRMKTAENGLIELQKVVDTLIVIPNQNLFRIANEQTTFADAFKMADDVLHAGVRSVTDLMIMPGLINLDFADIRAVMSEMGKAMMGTGEASGEDRALRAAEAAIFNPLLAHNSMCGARGVIINITGGLDMTLFEVDIVANRIGQEVGYKDANIIVGSTFNKDLEGTIRVSVVATGIDAEESKLEKNIKYEEQQNNEITANIDQNNIIEPILFEELLDSNKYEAETVEIKDLQGIRAENNIQEKNVGTEQKSIFSRMWNSLKSSNNDNHDTRDNFIHKTPELGSSDNIHDIPSVLRKKK